MDPFGAYNIIVILFATYGTAYLLDSFFNIKVQSHEYSSLDGLRGLLAVFVYIHHTAIWYMAIDFHRWSPPSSYVYTQFGSTSVSVFFMITAFLFSSRLINAYKSQLDWLKLYILRVFRILPLFFFAMLLLFLWIAVDTKFRLREPVFLVIKEGLQWLVFMAPNINGDWRTMYMTADVIWSLAFEWLFYFSLALAGRLVFQIRTSKIVLTVTSIFLMYFTFVIFKYYGNNFIWRIAPFGSGIAAAFSVRNQHIRTLATSHWVTVFLCCLILYVLFLTPSIYNSFTFCSVTIVFIAITCGNSFWGILTNKTCRLMGQISYSIYLLHGLLLFITYLHIVGLKHMVTLSALTYWLFAGIIAMVLIAVCMLTYQFIELPGINIAPDVVIKLRNWLKKT